MPNGLDCHPRHVREGQHDDAVVVAAGDQDLAALDLATDLLADVVDDPRLAASVVAPGLQVTLVHEGLGRRWAVAPIAPSAVLPHRPDGPLAIDERLGIRLALEQRLTDADDFVDDRI